MATTDSAGDGKPVGRFVTGSTMRHTAVMTATGSIGLVAVFIVDFFKFQPCDHTPPGTQRLVISHKVLMET